MKYFLEHIRKYGFGYAVFILYTELKLRWWYKMPWDDINEYIATQLIGG
jgi:hypothetical protein